MMRSIEEGLPELQFNCQGCELKIRVRFELDPGGVTVESAHEQPTACPWYLSRSGEEICDAYGVKLSFVQLPPVGVRS